MHASNCESKRGQEMQVLGSGKVLFCFFSWGKEIQQSNSPVSKAYLILVETTEISVSAELLFFYQNCWEYLAVNNS